MKDKEIKIKLIPIIIGLVIILAILTICYFVFHVPAIWPQLLAIIVSAFLGAGATAWVTNTLLKNQQSAEEEKEKNVKVYEEKLRIYQNYLQRLCDAVKDHQLSDEEKIKLQFLTAYTAMHSEDAHIYKISKSTSEILKCLCDRGNKGKDSSEVSEKLQNELFDIVNCFQEELYPVRNRDDEFRKKAAIVFAETFSSFESDNNTSPLTISTTINKTVVDDLPIGMDQTLIEKWNVVRKDEDGFRLERKGDGPGAIEIGFWEDHYYIQAEYDGFTDFAKTLKRKYGGRRSYGTWWRHIIDGGIYEIQQGEFLEKYYKNEAMQKAVIEWVNVLISDINSFTPFANWWNALNENGIIEKYAQNWSFWIWAEESTGCFERLVCDNVNEEYGNPFIDAYCADDKIVCVLYNREDNKDKLEKLITDRKLLPIKKVEEDRLVVIELPINSSEKELAKSLENLIEKIDPSPKAL